MAAKNEIPMTIEDLRNLRDSMLRYLGEYVEDLSKNHDVKLLKLWLQKMKFL